jgi:hypothetical protein
MPIFAQEIAPKNGFIILVERLRHKQPVPLTIVPIWDNPCLFANPNVQ